MLPRPSVRGAARALCLTSLVGSSGLASAVHSVRSANEPVTLTVAGCWTDAYQGPAFKKVVELYNRVQSKVHINGTWNNSFSKVLTEQLGGAPPDVYFDCSTGEVGTWAKNGYIRPLQPYIEGTHWGPNTLTPSARAFVTYQGRIWAMPFLEDTFMLLYNRTLFKLAGLDPDRPPNTWEQLRADADRLTRVDAAGKITQMGILPTFGGSDFVGTWLPVYMAAFGGRLIDASGKTLSTNCAACLAALQWERDLYDRWGPSRIDRFQSQFQSIYSGNGNAFFSGKTAMLIEGEYYVKQAQQYAPKLDYALAPIPYPAGHPEIANSGMAGGNPGMIMAGSKHPDEAWQFLRWVETLAPTVAFANAIDNVPQLRAAVDAPALDPNARFRTFVRYAQGPRIAVFPVIPISNELATGMTQMESLVLHDKISPKEGLRKLNADMQAKLGGNAVP